MIAQRGKAMIQACLESVFATGENSISREILVIDNASTDGTAEYLHSLGHRVTVLRNASKESFSQNNNLAANAARGEYLCFLGDDTVVAEGWLEKMVSTQRHDPRIGLVGNRHLDPDTGRIRHAGMVFSADGRPLVLYTKQPPDFWPALINQEFQILSAACWLLRRHLFLEMGGFDTDFVNGWGTIDFCLRVRQRGYKCFYVAESVIYRASIPIPEALGHEARDWDLFRCKWGMAITPDIATFYAGPDPIPEPVRIFEVEDVLEPPPSADTRSHIETRYGHVEALHHKHPWIASLLRAIIRLTTSVAKLLNRATS
ncbi:MAG: glycosyltransferase [Terrimicrobiaceae bacterium]